MSAETQIIKAPPVPKEMYAIADTFMRQRDRLTELCRQNQMDAGYVETQVLTAALQNPKLLECEPWSIWTAVTNAVQLGLEPCGPKRQGYLIPYKTRIKGGGPGGKDTWIMKCEWQPSYFGLITVVTESGKVKRPFAELVRDGDTFDVQRGTSPAINHVYSTEPDRFTRPVVAVYAAAMVDGAWDFEVMSACRDCYRPCPECKGKGTIWKKERPTDCEKCSGTGAESVPRCDVEHIRAKSKTPFDGPWVTDWPEMAKAKALKRFCKRLPKDRRMAEVIDIDNQDVREPEEAVRIPMPQRRSASQPVPTMMPEPPPAAKITAAQVAELQRVGHETGWSDEAIRKLVKASGWGDEIANAPAEAYSQLFEMLTNPPRAAIPATLEHAGEAATELFPELLEPGAKG